MVTKHLKGLNTLRFFAAFLVVIYHGRDHLHGMDIPFAEGLAIFSQGKTAVDFFFVLSGFLITYLAINELKKTGKINYKFFYVRRVLRIMPLYYITFFLMLAFLGFVAPVLLSQENVLGFPMFEGSMLYIFMLPNLVKPIWESTVGGMHIFWSIGVEEQFYLLFPAIIFFYTKILKKALYFASLFIVYFILYWIVKTDQFGFNSVLIEFVETLRFHYMIMGMLFATLSHKYLVNEDNGSLQKLINNIFFQIFIIGLVILRLFVSIEINPILEDFLSCLIFAFLILMISHRTEAKIFNSNVKILSYLGVISYGIYLLHPLVSYFVRLLVVKISFLNTAVHSFPIIYVALLFIFTVIVAHISYKYFELYFLKFKDKFR